MKAWEEPKSEQLPLKVCVEGREAGGHEGWGI